MAAEHNTAMARAAPGLYPAPRARAWISRRGEERKVKPATQHQQVAALLCLSPVDVGVNPLEYLADVLIRIQQERTQGVSGGRYPLGDLRLEKAGGPGQRTTTPAA
jgi:hypothetical protein